MIEIIIASGTKSNHTDGGDFKGEKHDNEGGSRGRFTVKLEHGQ